MLSLILVLFSVLFPVLASCRRYLWWSMLLSCIYYPAYTLCIGSLMDLLPNKILLPEHFFLGKILYKGLFYFYISMCLSKVLKSSTIYVKFYLLNNVTLY